MKVIAGTVHSTEGAVSRPKTLPIYADLSFASAAHFEQAIPQDYTAFVYVYDGAIEIAEKKVSAGAMGLFKQGDSSDGIVLKTLGPARTLLIAGQPLRQPIVQYGPFVMNTADEIREAFTDYHSGKFA